MAKSTKQPKPKPRTKVPDHLPALNPLELDAVQQRLMAESGISKGGKALIMQSLRAAANQNAESPETVIKTLDRDERKAVTDALQGYNQALNAPLLRGRARLMAVSDEEWQAALGEEGDE